VSAAAAQVATAELPVDLVARKRAASFLKRGEEDRARELVPGLEHGLETSVWGLWEDDCRTNDRGTIARLFFPTAELRRRSPWVDQTPGALAFMTGHGPFNSRLQTLGLHPTGLCECGSPQTVRHVIFDCLKYPGLFRQAREVAPPLDPEPPFVPLLHRTVGALSKRLVKPTWVRGMSWREACPERWCSGARNHPGECRVLGPGREDRCLRTSPLLLRPPPAPGGGSPWTQPSKGTLGFC